MQVTHLISNKIGGVQAISFHETRETPNDPKLSDCGARRAGCVVGERRRRKQVP